jgi:imidazole glycerol-phosphate synthase subunit HisH
MSDGPRVRVLDYEMGNLRSVVRALRAAGADVELSAEVGGDRLVLPGVGAFAEAVRRLGARVEGLKTYARRGAPLLGICLGMQLLFERSHEHGLNNGLGLFEGDVEPLPPHVTVPNMGWHRLEGLGSPYAYFAHSYGVRSSPHATATILHGEPWVAAVRRERIWGFQFHPEKSGPAGIQLLREWLAC